MFYLPKKARSVNFTINSINRFNRLRNTRYLIVLLKYTQLNATIKDYFKILFIKYILSNFMVISRLEGITTILNR